MKISGLDININRKDTQRIKIIVKPDLSIDINCPLDFTDLRIKKYVLGNYNKIKKSLKEFDGIRQSKRQYISGESIYFLGRRYLLDVIESNYNDVSIKNKKYIVLNIKEDIIENKEKLMREWYVKNLTEIIDEINNKYEVKINIKPLRFIITKMKRNWYIHRTNRVNFNLDMAKLNIHQIEYLVLKSLINNKTDNKKIVNGILDKFIKNKESIKRDISNSVFLH